MAMLPKFILFALLIKCGYCGKDIDESCIIGGMHVPGCNDAPSEEIQKELEKEKEEIRKEEEEKERNMTDEEREAKKKKEYKKLFFTNNIDWEIREELDTADDLIYNDTKKAIDLFEDILKRHPDSPRAKYALIRSKVKNGLGKSPKQLTRKLTYKLTNKSLTFGNRKYDFHLSFLS